VIFIFECIQARHNTEYYLIMQGELCAEGKCETEHG
jgi:hypothetical protein